MHINTAVTKHILPLLAKYEGKPVTNISLTTIAEEVKLQTNKGVNFRRVIDNAVSLARSDMKHNTFSFNIDATSEFRNELEQSSAARRDRFRHLYVRPNMPECRIGIKLEAVRTDTAFTINYVLEPESQRIYFVAIIGFYGNSINGWADRVNLGETVNTHSIPSTHFMSNAGAQEYVFILEKVVNFKVFK
ncbi:hypothetical protein HOS53_gp206 [Klebsiella phage May]|uniref:Uncharacterized protein n=1 Tax=Klebsiella phage May TaxID=2054272 RepID=A0A2H5BNQ1_9CAUD|nr:hypothetical protein HOS53_gp206 [Klebsiella phage May]AUG87954.1 hypothetical protein CPT_May_040 [Klebsiella phage May]